METDKNCRVLMTMFYLLGNVEQQQQLFSKLIWIIALILVDFVSWGHVMDDLMPPVIPRRRRAAHTLSDFAHDTFIHQPDWLIRTTDGWVGEVGTIT